MALDLEPLTEAVGAMAGSECRELATAVHQLGSSLFDAEERGQARALFALADLLANEADARQRAFDDLTAEPPGYMLGEEPPGELDGLVD